MERSPKASQDLSNILNSHLQRAPLSLLVVRFHDEVNTHSGSTRMITLIDREFTVNVSRQTAWRYLARVELWPSWAKHIERVEVRPQGELGPDSEGVIHLANGMKSTFRMIEFNPYRNWKWFGPFLWLTIHYDHRFESVNDHQTKMRFVLEASGPGVGSLGRLFARLYSRNLEKAIPRLIKKMELVQ